MKAHVVALVLCASTPVVADPIVLRADALASTAAPAGLITLAADGDAGPNLSAEAVVWTGGGTINDTGTANVLVIALRARTDNGRFSARVGRFVEFIGALRPVQLDGAAGRAALPFRIDVETFAGVPVVANITTSRSWDWIAGGRVSRRLGDSGSVGVAYAEQRGDGQLVSEEIGVDAGASITKRDDVAGKFAYDLLNPGVAEASIIASHRVKAFRVDLYSSYRAASHLLSATSLFSVLGDTPAERAGTTIEWRAAPRLDVGADFGVRFADGDVAPQWVARAKLRLDERGISALSGEVRRDGVGQQQWTGLRGVARIALPHCMTASTELELVIPDHDRGLGTVWPWALIALGWDNGTWHTALASEASASAESRGRLDVLIQIGRQWGKQ